MGWGGGVQKRDRKLMHRRPGVEIKINESCEGEWL